MSNVDESHETKNIHVILAALANPTCTPKDARMYSRAIARHLEFALAGAAAVASLFADALTAPR
jgi:hypothetical protein